MMQRKKDRKTIEMEIQKTLHCLDNAKGVKASPFFYTRVKQKIAALEVTGDKYPSVGMLQEYLSRLLIPALVAAGVLLGVFIGSDVSSSHRSHSQNIETFIMTYGLQAPDWNDYLLIKSE